MTYPLATLAAQVTVTGITAPSYNDILSSLKASAAIIFGADVYLEPDSQDGQLLAIFAQAIHDCNQTAIAVYNQFSPNTAQGAGLSSIVKINNIARKVATASQVNLTVVGQAGTTIVNGVAGDTVGNRWLLPSPTIIPGGGSIVVTATAEALGAIQAPGGTVTTILTPTAGWQTVNNVSAASAGLPIETDAALRVRQGISPPLNSRTVLQGLSSTLAAISGVSYSRVYENDTNITDSNGLPAHSISAVIKGGDSATIAQTIYDMKGPGVATYGTTTINALDALGASRPINYTVPTEKPIKATVIITAGIGYTSAIGDEIKTTIAAFVNALAIGDDVTITRLYVPALLGGTADSLTYVLTSVQAGLVSGSIGSTDIVMAYEEKATMLSSDVTITLI